MDADRAGLLGDLDDRLLDLPALAHDQVGELVDDDDDVRQALLGRHVRTRVERRDVADALRGERLVALLHLADGPVEGRLGLVGLDDDVLEQVRQPVVRRELDALEVDEDQPDLVRAGVHEDARDERVDAHALARAGRAGDQQVGHLGQVDRVGLARHVAAEGEGQPAGALEHLALLDERPEADDLADRVRGSRCRRRPCPGSAPRSGSSGPPGPSPGRPPGPRSARS